MAMSVLLTVFELSQSQLRIETVRLLQVVWLECMCWGLGVEWG